MRLDIDLPEWARSRALYLFAGTELLAVRPGGRETWRVKAGRCRRCGRCCRAFPPDWEGWPPAVEGTCVYLEEDGPGYICGLGPHRPLRCAAGGGDPDRGCTESFEVCTDGRL